MTVSKLMLGVVLTGAVTLSGCTTKTASPSEYSGFLSSYEGLIATKTATGHNVLRWTSADFKANNYNKIIGGGKN